MAVVLSKLPRKVRTNLQKKLGILQEAKVLKYRNVKVRLDGYLFDSQKERDVYLQLLMRQKMGEISELTVHPRFPLVVDGQHITTYVADFCYYVQHRAFVVVDVKGGNATKTRAYRMKKRLMKILLGIEIKEW